MCCLTLSRIMSTPQQLSWHPTLFRIDNVPGAPKPAWLLDEVCCVVSNNHRANDNQHERELDTLLGPKLVMLNSLRF